MKKLKLTLIILLFLIFTSWNIAMFSIDMQYQSSDSLSEDLEVLEEKYPNDKDIKNLREKVEFINSVCFGGENDNIHD
jgi:hypothetical protein